MIFLTDFLAALMTLQSILGLTPVIQEPNLGAVYIRSIQLAASPSNGNCLTTNGTDNAWSSCGTGGGGGGSSVGWTWNNINLLRMTTTTDDLLLGATATTSKAKLSVHSIGGNPAAYFNGNVGISSTTPGTALGVQGDVFVAGTITSTSTRANVLPYASTTAITAVTASSTNLYVSGASGALALIGTDGLLGKFAGSNPCTNQVALSISAVGVISCTSVTNAMLSNSTISGVSLGSNLNNLTINNGGAGTASGGTYNGSAAVTISYNSIGAVPTSRNINTTFPIQGGGDLSADRTITSAFSTTSNSGMSQGNLYVGSNGIFQVAASSSIFGFTPANNATTITVAGTANQVTSSAGAQDLSTNRTWTLSFPTLIINPNASTTLFSNFKTAYFGGIATTTIDTAGNITIPSGSSLTNMGRSDGCATWASAVLTSTGIACGSGGGGTPEFTVTLLDTFSTTTLATTTSVWTKGVFFASSTKVASQFPYASSTGISTSYASTSLLYANGLGGCSGGQYLTWSAGAFGCATDTAGGGFAWPWDTSTTFATTTRATSTSYWTQGVFFSSSTVAASQFPYASTTALSVSGNSFLGTVSSGVWNGSTIAIANGGTNQTSFPTTGGMIYYDGTRLTQSASGDPFFDAANSRFIVGRASGSFRINGVGTNGNGYLGIDSASAVTTGDVFLINASGNVGIATTTPAAKLAVTGNMFIAGNITSTSTLSSFFPYASSTAISTGYASSTSYFGAGLADCNTGNMLTWTAGRFGCEDDSTGAGGGANDFSWLSNYNVTMAATSSAIWAQAGLYASSTIVTSTSLATPLVTGINATASMYFDNSGMIGVSSSSPWGLFSISPSAWTDYTKPLFAVATSSGRFGFALGIFATSTSLNGGSDIGARVRIATTTQYSDASSGDHLFVDGRINSSWKSLGCDGFGGIVFNVASNVNNMCTGLAITPDTDGGVAALASNEFTDAIDLQASASSAASGEGAILGALNTSYSSSISQYAGIISATNTPAVIEVVASSPRSELSTSTPTRVIGFVRYLFNASLEYDPPSGAYFEASSTANWQAVYTNIGRATTTINTGISSSTASLYAPQKFRIELSSSTVKYYINNINVATINPTQAITAGLIPAVVIANNFSGTPIAQRSFYINKFRYWYKPAHVF